MTNGSICMYNGYVGIMLLNPTLILGGKNQMARKVKDYSRSEVKKIAMGYATTGDDFSATYFASLYGIPQQHVYSAIKRAIVESMIPVNVVKLIAAKSARNSTKHGNYAGNLNTLDKYRQLVERRKNFQFSLEQKEYYAIEYANSDQAVDMRVFSDINCMSKSLLQRTLVSAIVDNVVSDAVVEKLYIKAKQHNPSWKVEKFFNELRKQRKENKENEKARKKERKRQQVAQSEEEEIMAMIEAYMLNPEDQEKRKELDFIQMSMESYGIPDEAQDQLASIEASRRTIEGTSESKPPTNSEENKPEESQLSFFKN